MGEEALNKNMAKSQELYNDNDAQQDLEERDPQPYPEAEEKKEEEFKEQRSRRSERNKPKASNTNKQQTKQTTATSPNKQQERTNKGNQYNNLNQEDEDVFNDPTIVAIATQDNSRKADAGDFDTSKDWRITNYLKDKWNGHRPDELSIKIAKLTVTLWARSYPDYQTKQLGNNFTGKTKLGGLLTAAGKTLEIKGRAITVLLNDGIRNFTPLDTICGKLEDMIQQASKLPNNNNQLQPQPQQQPTTKPPATTTNNKAPSQPTPRASNKATSPNIANQTTITSHYNPLNSIVQDLTLSQEEKQSNTQVEDTVQPDDGYDNMSEEEDAPLAGESPAQSSEPPNSDGVHYALNGGTGGMPATVIAPTTPTASDGKTDN
jgi:hypothetical protein